MALVEMAVDVDHAGPDLAPVLVEHLGIWRELARGLQRCDPATLDLDVDQHLLAFARQRGVD
jgi:hypothetical protein